MRAVFVLLLLGSPLFAQAVAFRALPVEWRGFLSDLRLLRNAGNPVPGPNPLRDTLADRLKLLEVKAKPLSAVDAADLGECLIRLGQPLKALGGLREARRVHPESERLAVALAMAWAALNDWPACADAFDDAVRLAPPERKPANEAHRRLARLRAREPNGTDSLDDLFGVKYIGESGQPEAAKLSAAEKKKLPADAVAIVQELLVRMPGDARLLWQLAELANATEDVRTAANILDGCIGDFAMKSEDARARRKLYRAAADEREKAEDHASTRVTQRFKSSRLFAKLTDETRLPKIDPKGVNLLPWAALGDTSVGPKFAVRFLPYVAELDGKTVELTGFMQPFGMSTGEFILAEYPIGCWFCDQPGPLQVATIELTPGQQTEYRPGAVVITGKLELNRIEPERPLFAITGAKLRRAD